MMCHESVLDRRGAQIETLPCGGELIFAEPEQSPVQVEFSSAGEVHRSALHQIFIERRAERADFGMGYRCTQTGAHADGQRIREFVPDNEIPQNKV